MSVLAGDVRRALSVVASSSAGSAPCASSSDTMSSRPAPAAPISGGVAGLLPRVGIGAAIEEQPHDVHGCAPPRPRGVAAPSSRCCASGVHVRPRVKQDRAVEGRPKKAASPSGMKPSAAQALAARGILAEQFGDARVAPQRRGLPDGQRGPFGETFGFLRLPLVESGEDGGFGIVVTWRPSGYEGLKGLRVGSPASA